MTTYDTLFLFVTATLTAIHIGGKHYGWATFAFLLFVIQALQAVVK
jgi:hypothetical protein